MAILTRSAILREMESKMIIINPFDDKNLGSNSYDLTLYPELEIYEFETLDPKNQESFKTRTIKIPDSGLLLQKDECYLGRTNEYTETNYFVPVLQGKSSVGRMFIDVCSNAGYGDIGYKGYWTLNIKANKNVMVYPNMKICQIEYNTTEGIIRKIYEGKYQNSEKIEPSKIYEEYKARLDTKINNIDAQKMLDSVKRNVTKTETENLI